MLTREDPQAHQPAQNREATCTGKPVTVGAILGSDDTVSSPPHSVASAETRGAAATSPRPPLRSGGAPEAPGPALPNRAMPYPPSTAAPALRPLRARRPRRARGPHLRGESAGSAQLPGSECGRRLACSSRWAPPPACRSPSLLPQPSASPALSPQPSSSPPPPSWVRPAALRSNDAQLHWSDRPAALQHCSRLLVNLEQGAGPGRAGPGRWTEGWFLWPPAEGPRRVGLTVASAAWPAGRPTCLQ